MTKIKWIKTSDSKPRHDSLVLVFPGSDIADYSKYFESKKVIKDSVFDKYSEDTDSVVKLLISGEQDVDPSHHVVPCDGFYYNTVEEISESPIWVLRPVDNIEYWAYVTDPFDDETVGRIKWTDAHKTTPQRDRLVLAAIDCKLFDATKHKGILYYRLGNFVVTELYYQEAGDRVDSDLNDRGYEYEIAMENGYFYNARPNDRPYYTEFTGIVDYWVYIDEPYLD